MFMIGNAHNVPQIEVYTSPPVVIKAGKRIISNEASQGFGDTIAKITHATGLDKLADIYTNITGKPCGCQSRQEALNKLFPYGVKE